MRFRRFRELELTDLLPNGEWLTDNVPITIATIDEGEVFWGMSWGSDDIIVISNAYNGLKKIPAQGGTPRQLTVPAEGVVHNAPFCLPEYNLVL